MYSMLYKYVHSNIFQTQINIRGLITEQMSSNTSCADIKKVCRYLKTQDEIKNYTLMQSPIHQGVINLIANLLIRRCTSIFISVLMLEHRALVTYTVLRNSV
jgi:hypothetical protein